MTTERTPSHAPDPLPSALLHFDTLPDAANVRQPVVQGLFGVSAATVWRMVKRGTLPAPRKLSARVTAWNVGALRRCLKGQEAA
jgi:predicted DNA-binding transcriptional regulator AlpA